MKENDTIAIMKVTDLPPEVCKPIMADAEVFEKRYKERGPEWVYETMALLKYQVEGAHERIDQLSGLIHEIAQSLEGANGPADDDDWWKR